MSRRRSFPQFGESVPSRICAWMDSATRKKGPDAICGEPADYHFIWDPNMNTHTFVCKGHSEVAGMHHHFKYHDMGSYCGMPGARFDAEQNDCIYPDGLPLLEEPRCVAEPALA